MRLLYVTPDPGIDVDRPVGGGAHIRETVNQLRAMGHQVILAAPDSVASSREPERVTVRRHTWFPSRFYGQVRHRLNLLEEHTGYKFRFQVQVKQLIRRFRPDGVYERYALGHHGISGLCRRHGVPHVLEVNALVAQEAYAQNRLHPWLAPWVMDRERRFLASRDRVCVVSEHLKRRLSHGKGRVVVNPNGVDPDVFDPDRPLEDIRAVFRLGERPVIGWVGGFGKDRGVESVLRIAHLLHRRMDTLCLLMVGDGSLLPWVKKEAKALGLSSVLVPAGVQPRERVPAFIRAMDVALAPYPVRGGDYFSPLKVFEYMAMARAVAATDTGQCRQLLSGGGGLLLPPDRPMVWAGAVEALLQDEDRRKRMGRLARQRVLASHTWRENARRILDQFASPA